jgi:hypothetical protein
MQLRRWLSLVGLPLGFVLVAAVVIGLAQPPARAGGALSLARVAACPAGHGADGNAHPGAWWKTVDSVDANGSIVGRQLFVGSGSTARANATLPVESSVSGPVDGLVVVTSDDGSHSTVMLVDLAGQCSLTIDDRADVVRHAIIDPHDGSVFAHVVARDSRADLGTFRIGRTRNQWSSVLVAEPLAGALATEVGQVFGTSLAIDAGGRHLAVQSCTDLACLTRIFDLSKSGAAPVILRGQDQGPLLGFAGTEIVTWAACLGNPCAVVAWDIANGHSRQLAAGAEAASLTHDGRRLVARLASETGARLAEIDVATAHSSKLRGVPAGASPLATGPSAAAGLEVADTEVAIAIPGGDPLALNPDSAAEEALP